jgi:hypothetical protein
LRSLSIAMPSQLSLDVDPALAVGAERWSLLPTATREQLLVLLARMIARELVTGDEKAAR